MKLVQQTQGNSEHFNFLTLEADAQYPFKNFKKKTTNLEQSSSGTPTTDARSQNDYINTKQNNSDRNSVFTNLFYNLINC